MSREKKAAARSMEQEDKHFERASELQDREHRRQLLEATQKQLKLEIDVVWLRRAKGEARTTPPTAMQSLIDETLADMEQGDVKYTMLQDTVNRELALHAKIDAAIFPTGDPEVVALLRSELKKAVSIHFEAIRTRLGYNIRVDQKDCR